MSQFLCSIKALDFQDEHKAYNHQLELITRMVRAEYLDQLYLFREHHDISQILKKIKSEKQAHMKGLLRRFLNKVFGT
ncbi:hypothetical protein BDZ97DRAFT_2061266 [Flammula alnicola]|nr:hypothetical protein BDZ97DRAFT_2061266 [Flammula alnicola]